MPVIKHTIQKNEKKFMGNWMDEKKIIKKTIQYNGRHWLFTYTYIRMFMYSFEHTCHSVFVICRLDFERNFIRTLSFGFFFVELSGSYEKHWKLKFTYINLFRNEYSKSVNHSMNPKMSNELSFFHFNILSCRLIKLMDLH